MRAFFVVLAACLFSAFADVTEEDGVLVVTDDNWEEAVPTESAVLVEFYAPWCGHCKSLAPEYAKAAKLLGEKNAGIKLAKVDATVHTKLGEKYGVQGYPTLKLFKNGTDEPMDYSGGRTADEIVQWLEKKTGPPAVILEKDGIDAFRTGKEVSVVGYFEDLEGAAANEFKAAASAIDTIDFALVQDTAGDKIVLLKEFDGGDITHKDGMEKEKIKAFVTANSIRLLSEFTDETAPKIFGGDIKVHLLAFLSKSSDVFTGHTKSLTETAATFKGKVLFVYIDTDVEDNERILEFFSLKKVDTPTYRLIDLTNDMAKFVPESESFQVESINAFVNGVLDGTIKPHLKSEAIPEDWDKAPVKVLVGKNFKEAIKDRDVFVEFYAPWCGHCKQLAPVWDRLGETMKDSDKWIAKMDSTQNDLEDVKVQSFPTLKLFKKDGQVIDYNGPRNYDALLKFVQTEEMPASDEEEEDGEGADGDEDEEFGGELEGEDGAAPPDVKEEL